MAWMLSVRRLQMRKDTSIVCFRSGRLQRPSCRPVMTASCVCNYPSIIAQDEPLPGMVAR